MTKRKPSMAFHRYRTAYEIVRNRNRDLPELEFTDSAHRHERRTRQAEEEIRQLIDEQQLLTLPADTPATFDTDTFWSPRALTDRHFWEEIQFRNAFNNHIHASIPGHRFDGQLAKQVENPIRRGSVTALAPKAGQHIWRRLSYSRG